jgi:hypothetical protein
VLAGADVADLPAAVVAVLAATWASLRLLPPSGYRASVLGLARLAGRFLGESVVAGLDVAKRALDPRLPMRPVAASRGLPYFLTQAATSNIVLSPACLPSLTALYAAQHP